MITQAKQKTIRLVNGICLFVVGVAFVLLLDVVFYAPLIRLLPGMEYSVIAVYKSGRAFFVSIAVIFFCVFAVVNLLNVCVSRRPE